MPTVAGLIGCRIYREREEALRDAAWKALADLRALLADPIRAAA